MLNLRLPWLNEVVIDVSSRSAVVVAFLYAENENASHDGSYGEGNSKRLKIHSPRVFVNNANNKNLTEKHKKGCQVSEFTVFLGFSFRSSFKIQESHLFQSTIWGTCAGRNPREAWRPEKGLQPPSLHNEDKEEFCLSIGDLSAQSIDLSPICQHCFRWLVVGKFKFNTLLCSAQMPIHIWRSTSSAPCSGVCSEFVCTLVRSASANIGSSFINFLMLSDILSHSWHKLSKILNYIRKSLFYFTWIPKERQKNM